MKPIKVHMIPNLNPKTESESIFRFHFYQTIHTTDAMQTLFTVKAVWLYFFSYLCLQEAEMKHKRTWRI